MAARQYHTKILASQIRRMSAEQLHETLRAGQMEYIDRVDTRGIMPMLQTDFAAGALSGWARDKFGLDIPAGELVADPRTHAFKPAEQIVELITKAARDAYRQREIQYPVDHMLGMVGAAEVEKIDNPYAADFLPAVDALQVRFRPAAGRNPDDPGRRAAPAACRAAGQDARARRAGKTGRRDLGQGPEPRRRRRGVQHPFRPEGDRQRYRSCDGRDA